jgi:hypothetical protein
LTAADHPATPLILLEHNDDHLTSFFYNLSSFFSIMLFCSCISGRSSFIMPVKDTTEGKTACTLMIGALFKHLKPATLSPKSNSLKKLNPDRSIDRLL